MVALPNRTDKSPTPFGSLFAFDDPLRIGSEPTSEVIGNAQSLYLSSSQDINQFDKMMYADFAFTTGKFKGSSFGVFSRTVADAVHVFDAIAGFDYNDQATKEASKYIPYGGYVQFLKPYGLKGKRLGIVRNPFFKYAKGSALAQYEHHLRTLRYSNTLFQAHYFQSQATNGIGNTEKAAWLNLAKLSRDGFEKVMMENSLDALVTPGAGIALVLAIGGFPGISVPTGFTDQGVPFGFSFGGLKGTEPKLIEIAYGFEQATMIRMPPSFKP
ncbi:hypothetical protein Dsin_026152 [Dipteronia sinensis]|uniref:Dirigent protein n=1 Tax=Dipteronia sinensis TaxID=43782 RepID=A0AAD9ZX41_9ROSI|nr:hypothetical protein Dsin_026152 [Dipteronia sinensis]